MLRAGLVQLNASDDPQQNLPVTLEFVRQAAVGGARFVLTPEVTNCVSQNRARQKSVLQPEQDDISLLALQSLAASLGIWISVGSLALKSTSPDERFLNRSYMISPTGAIAARYDKIHMFDVQVTEHESFRESAGFRPGNRATVVKTDFGAVGMTICYDLRFPTLYRSLAKAGAQILTVPSAFSPATGPAHWETLLRARAIEAGCFVLAPAQTGKHPIGTGKARQTWGHSLAVSPWGDVLADGGTKPGVTLVDLNLKDVDAVRKSLPSLQHDREFECPN